MRPTQKINILEIENTAVSEVFTTELANFLATAYAVPASLLDEIFTKTSCMDERNFNVVVCCFLKYMAEAQSAEFELEPDKIQTSLGLYFTEFLAYSVMRRYSKTIVVK